MVSLQSFKKVMLTLSLHSCLQSWQKVMLTLSLHSCLQSWQKGMLTLSLEFCKKKIVIIFFPFFNINSLFSIFHFQIFLLYNLFLIFTQMFLNRNYLNQSMMSLIIYFLFHGSFYFWFKTLKFSRPFSNIFLPSKNIISSIIIIISYKSIFTL